MGISAFSFLFYFIIYLFIYWLCWVFVAACGLFSSCGVQAPEHVGSLIEALELSSWSMRT